MTKWSKTIIGFSERPIRVKLISADTDNRSILPILSADISADFQPKLKKKCRVKLTLILYFSALIKENYFYLSEIVLK